MNGFGLFGLVLCSLFLRAEQAYFSSKPPQVMKAIIGQDVVLPWNFTLEKEDKLLIMQLEYSKINDFEGSARRIAEWVRDMLSIQKAFKNKVSVEFSGSLTLHNVTVEEQGFYRCSVKLQDQDKDIRNKTQLLVGVPPVIHTDPPSIMTLLEGDHVDIKCESSGIPVPNVSWYRQTQHGWKKLSGRRLQIKVVKQADSGYYKCFSRNFMGVEERTMKLSVYEKPIVTSFFHTAALDDIVYECDKLTFTCEARGSKPPIKNIYIYHEGRLVHRSVNKGKPMVLDRSRTVLAGGIRSRRLRIAKISKRHEGKYYCVAENEHGFGNNKTIDLKVFDAPENCERRRTNPGQSTRTTKTRFGSSLLTKPTDHSSFSTTKEKKVLGRKDSGCSISKPNTLMFATWVCHLVFCWIS